MERAKRKVWPDSATATARYSGGEFTPPAELKGNDPAGSSTARAWKDVLARSYHGLLGRKRPNPFFQQQAPVRLSRAQKKLARERKITPRSVIPEAAVPPQEYFDQIVITDVKQARPEENKEIPEFIPSIGKVRDRRRAGKLPPDPLEGKMEEEMVRLHQMVLSSLQANAHMLILFTGSLKGEGTSTVAREFARVSATRFRKKTLFFDADWRQGALGRLSRRTDPVAVERVVREGISLERALMCIKKPHLYACLLSANREFCPDLYDLPAMRHIWTGLKECFDVVVVDASPTDTSLIAKHTDGVIFVMKADSTRWPVAMAAKQEITDNGGNILGMVLNDRRFYIPKPIYRRL